MDAQRERKRKRPLDLQRQAPSPRGSIHARMQARPRRTEHTHKRPLLRRGTQKASSSPSRGSDRTPSAPPAETPEPHEPPEPPLRLVSPQKARPPAPSEVRSAPRLAPPLSSSASRPSLATRAPPPSGKPTPGAPMPVRKSTVTTPGPAIQSRSLQLARELPTEKKEPKGASSAGVSSALPTQPRASTSIQPRSSGANRTFASLSRSNGLKHGASPARPSIGTHRGLQSYGNTCYLNSVLQVLVHTSPLVALCRAVPSADEYVPAHALAQLATAIWGGGPHPVFPRTFYEHLPPPLLRGRQEDAHEYLRLLLDTMSSASPGGAKLALGPGAISPLFQGRFRSRVTCLSCRASSDTFDVFADVSLDISSARITSLADALARFTQPDQLAGGNEYVCPSCGVKSPAIKYFTIHQVPAKVLTIHLKRFDWAGTKLLRPIVFPHQLELSPYMSPGQGHGTYELYAIVHHYGSGAHEGHYVASIREVGDSTRRPRWFRFDDESVHPHALNTADPSAYMLFYLRRE